MRYEPQIHGASIVVVGTFNPTIFSPAWLAMNGVVTQQEMAAAEIAVIHADLSQFSINPISVHVTQDRFQAECTQEPFARLLDFVQSIFTILRHTPVSQVGINYQIHFLTPNVEQRTALGRALAPLEPWGDWGREIGAARLPEQVGGLADLVIQQNSPGGRNGYRRVQIEPSRRVDLATGVFMAVNDHYNLSKPLDPISANELVDLLGRQFDASIAWSKAMVGSMMDLAASLK